MQSGIPPPFEQFKYRFRWSTIHLNVNPFDPCADAAQNVVRYCARDPGKLLGIDRGIAFHAQQCDIVARCKPVGVGQVDGGQIQTLI